MAGGRGRLPASAALSCSSRARSPVGGSQPCRWVETALRTASTEAQTAEEAPALASSASHCCGGRAIRRSTSTDRSWGVDVFTRHLLREFLLAEASELTAQEQDGPLPAAVDGREGNAQVVGQFL